MVSGISNGLALGSNRADGAFGGRERLSGGPWGILAFQLHPGNQISKQYPAIIVIQHAAKGRVELLDR